MALTGDAETPPLHLETVFDPLAARLKVVLIGDPSDVGRTMDMQGFRNALSAHFDSHQLSHVSAEFAQMRGSGLASAIERGRR